MIIGTKCNAISQCGSSIFITLEDEAGRSIRIQQPSNLPVEFKFGAFYAVEIAEAVEIVEGARPAILEVIR